MPNKDNTQNTNEEQLQKQWEEVLRGDFNTNNKYNKTTQQTAYAIRSYVLWQQSREKSPQRNELGKQAAWKVLLAKITEEKSSKKIESNTFYSKLLAPKQLMGIAASIMVTLIGVQLWQYENTMIEPPQIQIPSEKSIGIKKGTLNSKMIVYKAIPVKEPLRYAKQLQEDLINTGFQVDSPEAENGEVFVKLQIKNKLTAEMKQLLDKHKIKLNADNKAYLHIIPATNIK